VSLPDAGGLDRIAKATVRALGQRLRALELPKAYDAILALGGQFPDALTRPIRVWHLRRSSELVAFAMRCWMYDDPIAEKDARAVLGALPLELFLEHGLLTKRDGGVACPFPLQFSDEVLFFGDDLRHGGDAVMSLGRMTIGLTRAAWPNEPVETALDLGCGSGVSALLLADRAAKVIATDINPRAATLARFNVALNGLDNVEVRFGDMFEPLAGESFDLVVSQPPFVPSPGDLPGAVYMHGGRRGDELPLRFLAGVPSVLAPGGRALFYVQWPEFDGDPVPERLRASLARDDVDLLLLDGGVIDPATYCIGEAVVDGLRPDDFERKCVGDRENLARMGIVGTRDTITVVRRVEGRQGFTAVSPIDNLEASKLRHEHVDSLLNAHEVLFAGREALLAARVRFPDDTAIAVRRDEAVILFTERWFRRQVTLAPSTLAQLQLVGEAPSVRDAARRYAKQTRATFEEAADRLLPTIREALAGGLLVLSAQRTGRAGS
jgi:methylase of polypeptide subunit release factors